MMFEETRPTAARGGTVLIDRVGFQAELADRQSDILARKSDRIGLIAFVVSYVLFYALGFVYIASYEDPHRYLAVGSGAITLITFPKFADVRSPRGNSKSGWTVERSIPMPWTRQWPRYSKQVIGGGYEMSRVNIPLWIPLLPLLALSAFVIHRDRTWPKPGQCAKCRYDLRGLASDRCPECGTSVPERLAANAGKV
jgi:hypothetical protein